MLTMHVFPSPGHKRFPSSDHIGATTLEFDVVRNRTAHALAEDDGGRVCGEMRDQRILEN